MLQSRRAHESLNRAFAENEMYNPSRTPGLNRAPTLSPTKTGSSPFKPAGKVGNAPPGRSAFGDKTNASPSPRASPSKLCRTPANSKLGASPWKASSLVTPATNVGHAGEIKTRLGEKQNAVQECTETEQTSVEMEDEYYPEIEYIPPSMALDGSWRVFTH